MKHARVSETAKSVHAVYRRQNLRGRPYQAVCGAEYRKLDNGSFKAQFWPTDEPVSCLRCLSRMERLTHTRLENA